MMQGERKKKSVTYTKEKLRKEVMKSLIALSSGRQCDVMKLIFSGEELSPEVMKKMDFSSVSEVKRLRDGGVEIKFFDRYRALELLLKAIQEEEGETTLRQFYEALSNTVSGSERED